MKLSDHFELREFDCKSGEAVPDHLIPNVHDLVMGVLEPLRVRWNAPIVVMCGYRDPSYNEALYEAAARRAARLGGTVGVAKNSTHITASGADIHPLNPSDLPAFFSTIEEMRVEGKLQTLGGLGKYRNWAHVDIKRAADGHLRRWHGAGFGSEQ